MLAYHLILVRNLSASQAPLNVYPDIAHASYVADCILVANLESSIFPILISFIHGELMHDKYDFADRKSE